LFEKSHGEHGVRRESWLIGSLGAGCILVYSLQSTEKRYRGIGVFCFLYFVFFCLLSCIFGGLCGPLNIFHKTHGRASLRLTIIK
jgi:hypothetical protein